ncbi:MAG: enoyl-CoA hydratase/isomerase family protein [Gammaproteobacteria bacterium]|nr:enoyl-CoA hydratase/isomerase family protein [Gammaproteobacteria bacterium]MBU1442477.1 enoyl-CoA hydratase/isomerase family protein [Gammaproteobacteria bacterium]MBU2287411.1 enoyl-CoA hydratase/isomerase family protein [Gammaproteobacteria bacterium]
MATQEAAGGTPHFEVQGAVARITLARPAHRNRLHNEDLAALMALFERIDGDTSIRAVVLGAQVLPQRPVFSAGFNATEFDDAPGAVSFEQVVDALERLRPVTICALNGSVYGGATDFVLACDLALGAEGIEMRMPAAKLGLHYYPSGLSRYVSRLGVNVAKRAFLTAEPLDAATLLRVGYLQELVPAADLPARVDRLAEAVSQLAPLAVEALKRSLNDLARGEFDLAPLDARQRASMESEDFAEGRRAFAEKRAPVWKRR